MFTNLKKSEKGFTIIEVLIVLAIAGLIMLVVFLAVPALQRNSRNTQRNSDAALIAAAVNECITNKNGRTQSCAVLNRPASGAGGAAVAAVTDGVPVDANKLSQLKAADGSTSNVTFCGQQGGTACATFTAATGTAAWSPAVAIRYGDRCNDDGDDRVAGTARSFALLYQVETNGANGITRCLDS